MLQALLGRCHPGAQSFLDLAPGRRALYNVPGGLYGLQLVVTLDLAHQRLLPPVIVAVAHHLAVKANSVHHQVNVFMFGILMAGDHVLVACQSHAGQIPLADVSPCRIAQTLIRRSRQRHMQHSLAQGRPQLADLTKFLGQRSWRLTFHVGIDQAALFLA